MATEKSLNSLPPREEIIISHNPQEQDVSDSHESPLTPVTGEKSPSQDSSQNDPLATPLVISSREDELEKAREYFQQAQKIMRDPKKYKEGIKLLTLAIAIDPDQPHYHGQYGYGYFSQQKYEEALPYLKDAYNIAQHIKDEKVNSFRKSFINCLDRIASQKEKNHEYIEAERYYKEALSLDEEDTHSNHSLALFYYNRKKYHQALGYFQKNYEKKSRK